MLVLGRLREHRTSVILLGMKKTLAAFGYAYALLAIVTSALICAAVVVLLKISGHGGALDVCYPSPAGVLVGEYSPELDLSWFPFGYQCTFPAVGGGKVVVPPADWGSTLALVVAVVLFTSAIVVLLTTSLMRRRRVQLSR